MMDDIKWTPGPWSADGDKVVVDTRIQVCCGRSGLTCCGEPEIDGDYFEIAQTSEKDAGLIAAAPDMYAALVAADERLAIMEDMSDNRGNDEWIWEARDMIKSALAKAKGA